MRLTRPGARPVHAPSGEITGRPATVFGADVDDEGPTVRRAGAALQLPMAALTADSAETATVTPSSSQLASATTGRSRLRASAISLSVPQPPPIAITASAAAVSTALRASPRPVAIASVR